MKIIVLGTKKYEDKNKNYGDCIIVDSEKEIVVYDCGSDEHALRVIDYLDERGIDKATFVLSHNDEDHFKGLRLLIEKGKVGPIYTVLLLKYVDELLERIPNERKGRESFKEYIKELYSNIAELSGQDLRDIFEESTICDGIEIVGPDKEYMLDAAAKFLDINEGDTIDGETIKNATSVQAAIKMDSGEILLTGDSSFASIENIIKDYNAIQLPHHGKLEQAEKIFEANDDKHDVTYIVSDNTGDSNGGSNDLSNSEYNSGYIIKNTKQDGDISIGSENILVKPISSYCNNVMGDTLDSRYFR